MNNEEANLDMRTPLAKARALGSAHSGTAHFWQQRISALFNIPLCLFLLALFISAVGKGYYSVHHIFTCPIIAALSVLAVCLVIYHMKIGLQVVIEDYIHKHLARVVVLALNAFLCYSLIVINLLALLKLNFGS